MPCPYAGDFRCAINGGCIRADDVCDVTEHCLDGSDEGLNCKLKCIFFITSSCWNVQALYSNNFTGLCNIYTMAARDLPDAAQEMRVYCIFQANPKQPWYN